ncbi:astroprincin family protein [Flectobacillus longus]|uniref:astroprincin family protein n=1 Tax=Flectobacillus longus TaxID=2984207 RepID=UPI0024B78D1D|nr:astroprincin family protein [Flectobacillus longus]MDI9881686.1 hypothetical protein [Flectobacillus longus]
MKTVYNLKNIYRILIILVLSIGTFLSCQKINPFDDLELTVNTDIYKAPLLIKFVNANAASSTIPQGLKVTISGAGKDYVLSDAGKKEYIPTDNVLSLVLNKNVSPSVSSPIEFTVSISGNGYVSTSKTFVITDTELASFYEIPVTKVSEPPTGVASTVESVNLTQGEKVVVPATVEKPEVAEITLQPGTQVRDASGATINANNVSVQVVQYTTETTASLQSFPGGFGADNVIMNNGSTTDGDFITGGFVAIDMEADGKAVKSFSKPIQVSVGINADLTSPETGEKIKEGDTIPTWSYDSNTGQWKEEGIATVIRGSDGKLTATFEASHLSYWNLDWYFYGSCSNSGGTVKLNVSSNISSNVNSYDYYGVVYLVDRFNRKYYYTQLWDFDVRNGNTNNGLYRAIRGNGNRLQIMVYSRRNNQLLGSTSVFDACSTSSMPITLNVPNPPTYIDVDIDFTAKCSNKKLNIKPSTWLYLFSLSNGGIYGGYVYAYSRSGLATVRVIEGQTYEFYTYYNGTVYTGRVTMNKTSSVITTSTGKPITGSTSYNPATNRVKLLATYTANDCK